jgi:hypothetical protein
MLWVGRAGAVARPSGDSASTAKLEVGGVEGAGVSPFFTAGASPVDQLAGKLRRRHPDCRLQSWILRREFWLESRLSHIHRQPRLMAETVVMIPYRVSVFRFKPLSADGVYPGVTKRC